MRETNSGSQSEELDRSEAKETSRRNAVHEELREDHFANDFRLLRQELIPYAEALGIYTDEDVFRAAENDRRSRPS